MSGEAGGLAILPIVGILYPPLGIAMVGGALAIGIGSAVVNANRAERRRREREAIRNAREAQRIRNIEANRNSAANNAWNNNGGYNNNYESQKREAEYRAQREAAQRAQQEAENRARKQAEMQRVQQMDMVSNSIGSFRSSVAATMKEQTRLNKQASDQMMAELDRSRNDMMEVVRMDDPQKYLDYVSQLNKSKGDLSKKLHNIQDGFVKNYQTKISESMDSISKDINAQYVTYLDELKKIQDDIQKKNEMAKSLADDYIEEAKTLLLALGEDYQGQKYSHNQMLEIEKSINDAIAQYNIGNYEAAIAVAKDSALVTIEEIYKADCKQQEWDNYYKLALVVANEVEGFIKAQATITAEAKAQVEQKIGKQIEDDIVGVSISEYTGNRADGKTQYEYMLEQAQSIVKMLESDEVDNLSVEQLKNYADMLNNTLYPNAAKVIFEGILNMSNAFSRQNLSEEIIDFFEEHNFNFTGYSYDDDKHDGALRIGLENETTGEEIIVTLAPELMENGEVQTRVEIDQLKGDETNEARKEFYRQSVTECVTGSAPGAQIKLECKHETRNKLSDKTELRDRLQQ